MVQMYDEWLLVPRIPETTLGAFILQNSFGYKPFLEVVRVVIGAIHHYFVEWYFLIPRLASPLEMSHRDSKLFYTFVERIERTSAYSHPKRPKYIRPTQRLSYDFSEAVLGN